MMEISTRKYHWHDVYKMMSDWNRWGGITWKYSLDPFVTSTGDVLGPGRPLRDEDTPITREMD